MDAIGGAEGSHFIRYIREHPLPRVLSPSRFPEVRICRHIAHTRVLRASRCALPSCEGYAAKEAVLDTRDGGALAHRLAAHKSRRMILPAFQRFNLACERDLERKEPYRCKEKLSCSPQSPSDASLRTHSVTPIGRG